jgi:hypothetical protein
LAILPVVFGGFGAALLIVGGASAVARIAGRTIGIFASLTGFVVGGGSYFFAITGGAAILGRWMSPTGAILSSSRSAGMWSQSRAALAWISSSA